MLEKCYINKMIMIVLDNDFSQSLFQCGIKGTFLKHLKPVIDCCLTSPTSLPSPVNSLTKVQVNIWNNPNFS